MIGKCKLCGEEKELCKESHIIPNFMYKDLFDEKHRLNVVQSKDGKLERIGLRQSGEWDKNILCSFCDNKTIGELERYASLILYGGSPKTLETRVNPNGVKYMYCGGINYAKFKLFLLSVLWRASVSERPLFKEVKLGPHEERIRQMILKEDPGNQLKYPCLIMTYLHLSKYPSDVIAQPSRSKIDGGYIYKFMINGIIYIFFISKHIISDKLKDFSINEKGEMSIIHATEDLTKKALGSMMGVNLW